MSKIKIPYCPKCGEQNNVEPFDVYFRIWKCKSCKIRFDFSKLNEDSINKKPRTPFENIIDPARKITVYQSILDPSRKISFEKINQNIKIVADVKSTEELFNSLKLKHDFKSPFDNEAISKKGHIKTKGGESNDLKI